MAITFVLVLLFCFVSLCSFLIQLSPVLASILPVTWELYDRSLRRPYLEGVPIQLSGQELANAVFQLESNDTYTIRVIKHAFFLFPLENRYTYLTHYTFLLPYIVPPTTASTTFSGYCMQVVTFTKTTTEAWRLPFNESISLRTHSNVCKTST